MVKIDFAIFVADFSSVGISVMDSLKIFTLSLAFCLKVDNGNPILIGVFFRDSLKTPIVKVLEKLLLLVLQSLRDSVISSL